MFSEADRAGSRIDLSALQRFTDVDAYTTSQSSGEYSSLKATGGGEIKLGSIDSLEGIWVCVDSTGDMDLSTVLALQRGRLEAVGKTLALPT